ncbi:hypothetical protein F8M41_020127 [Gigaspora margarita]|uniref:F-box domain-containing protein n=1 Tax=Gigaspora margarita TaxID=4874 RepID=A0A8H4AIV6_GIGMA|nr:hypothetical protein F8M41_020127 [Gigaspora margarita]
MASKILMSDMAELMENILNNLNNECHSLYSCALVNRIWCKMTIPILWQNPFSFNRHSFIPKYFSSLNEDENFILKELSWQNATKINTLELEEFYSDYEPLLFHSLFQAIICFIKSQDQLSLFSVARGDFPAHFHGIISALEGQKYSLQEVIIESYGYSAEFRY